MSTPAGTPEADDLIAALGLVSHVEGGWFRETWRAAGQLDAYGGRRALGTSILYLLRPGERSRWHRVRSAELWLWQGGGPLTLHTGGTGAVPQMTAERTLDGDPRTGELQILVQPGEWQAARPAGDRHVLVACVVVPGFDMADFEVAPDAPGE